MLHMSHIRAKAPTRPLSQPEMPASVPIFPLPVRDGLEWMSQDSFTGTRDISP